MRHLFYLLVLLSCIDLSAQNALHFDGSNDAMNCGTDTSVDVGGTSFTAEAWISADGWQNNIYEGTIVLKENNTTNGGWMLRAGNNGNLGCGIGAGVNGSWSEINTSSLNLSLYAWYHVATTYDGSYLRLYLNGTILDSLSVSINVNAGSSTPLTVGYHPTYGRHWYGAIDEVRVWDRALSSSEIASHMNEEFCSRQSNYLRAYYKFSQGTANGNNSSQTTVIDYSNFQNNASLNSFGLSGSTSNYIAGAPLSTDSSYSFDTLRRCGAFYDPGTKTFYSTTGDHSFQRASYMGCDSFVNLRVVINKNTFDTLHLSSCDSVIGPTNKIYRKTGSYTEVISNHLGCDSIISLQVRIGADTFEIDTTVCELYTSVLGRLITSSGTYYDTLSNSIGCDSIIQMNVVVNYDQTASISQYICDSVQSPSARYWYYAAGMYYDTLSTQSGCDSIIQINLSYAGSSSSIEAASCYEYFSPAGLVYTQSGIYYDTISNHLACDSIIEIDLSILESSERIFDLSGCDSAMNHDGSMYFTMNGTYYDTLVNAVGCDSFITQNVVITSIDNSVSLSDEYTLLANSTAASYQWLDCNNNFSAITGEDQQSFQNNNRGNFAVELKQNGCVDTSACYSIAGLGLKHSILGTIKCYPNPSEGRVTISSDNVLTAVNVELFDMKGSLIKTMYFNTLKEIEVDLTTNSGLYLLMINSSEGVYRQNILIP